MNRNADGGARTTLADAQLLQDAWQAASMLVGLFGQDASSYAAEELARCLAARDLAGATTWSLIASQINLQLTGHTDRNLN